MNAQSMMINSAFILLFLFISSCDQFTSKNTRIRTKDGWKEYSVTVDGDSIQTIYNKNGKKNSEYMFKKGYFHGKAYKYYDNGNIQYELNYVEGYKHGLVKFNYESGKLYKETLYEMGKRTGVQKKYYENGNLQAEIFYKDDKVQPGLKEYKKDGAPYKIFPKLRIKEIDKTVFEDKVILEVYLDPKGSKTRYSIIKTIGGKEYNISLKNKTKKGKAYIEFPVLPGEMILEKVKIKAVTRTKRGNKFILFKTYNLAVENKM